MKVAFLGMGAMGSRMATRLLADHEVTVWSRTAASAEPVVAAGATRAETPADAARGADAVFVMVTDDEASRAVWLGEEGVLAGLAKGAVALESSTVTPAWARELGAQVNEIGAHFLDAPVAGSTPQAEAGQLAFLVGGAPETVERVRPLLDAMSKVVIHAGPLGQGAVLKLLVNALFATQVAAVADLLRAASQEGMAVERAAELLAPLPVTSPAAQGVMGLMVAGDHASRFPVRLVAKDLRYAGAIGAGPVIEAAQRRFEAAEAAGWGDRNLSVLVDGPPQK